MRVDARFQRQPIAAMGKVSRLCSPLGLAERLSHWWLIWLHAQFRPSFDSADPIALTIQNINELFNAQARIQPLGDEATEGCGEFVDRHVSVLRQAATSDRRAGSGWVHGDALSYPKSRPATCSTIRPTRRCSAPRKRPPHRWSGRSLRDWSRPTLRRGGYPHVKGQP